MLITYNRRYEGVSETDIKHQISSLNNTTLIRSYLKSCAVKNATQLIKENDNKQLIFGDKKNFIDRCKGKITKDEFINKRLSKLYIIGETNRHGNRFIKINEDLESFTFKPTIKDKIILPDVNDFNDRYIKSLEEFNITGEIKDIVKYI